MAAPTVATIHKNQTLNAIAILTTIVVGGFTIYYLVQQTKFLKLQIDKHVKQHGDLNGDGKVTNEKSPK